MQVMRVPLDFEWPIGKKWDGYVNPFDSDCEICGGSGYTNEATWVLALTHFIVTIGVDGIQSSKEKQAKINELGIIWPHPYVRNWSCSPKKSSGEVIPPSRELGKLILAIAEIQDEDETRLYDENRQYIIFNKLLDFFKIKNRECPKCLGEGMLLKEKYDAWEPTDPPTGDGWQVWDDDAPVSTVFSTRNGVTDHLLSLGISLAQFSNMCDL